MCHMWECYKLSIDHINMNGGEHRIGLGINSSYQFYLWLKGNNYPDGYRVLCTHCNSRIRDTKGLKHHWTGDAIVSCLAGKELRAKEIISYVSKELCINQRAVGQCISSTLKLGRIKRIRKGVYAIP
jgi:hypothetical protein